MTLHENIMASTPFDPFKLEFETNFEELEEEEGGGDEGGEEGSGTTGTGALGEEGVLWWLDTNFKQEIRDHERKFGTAVPFTDDPLRRQQSALGNEEGERLHGHPLFADTQRFDGIFEDINNPSPPQNPEALDRYNEYQLRHANTPKPTSTPRFERRR